MKIVCTNIQVCNNKLIKDKTTILILIYLNLNNLDDEYFLQTYMLTDSYDRFSSLSKNLLMIRTIKKHKIIILIYQLCWFRATFYNFSLSVLLNLLGYHNLRRFLDYYHIITCMYNANTCHVASTFMIKTLQYSFQFKLT